MSEEAAPLRFRALVAYDGGRYHGWQFQPGLPTIQGELERAIAKSTGQRIRVQGAGRTDAGVHALGQVANFTLATRLESGQLRLALNAHLPPDIRVYNLEPAPEGFSARNSAHWRLYRYFLARRRSPFLRGRVHVPRIWPDLPSMNAGLSGLLGEHDFRAFTTQAEGPYGCALQEARWEEWEGGFAFTIRSDRYLYQMVRILVGTCLEIGRGRLSPDSLARILSGRDRRAAGPLAPACGLYLVAVGYDPLWPDSDAEAGGGPALPGAV